MSMSMRGVQKAGPSAPTTVFTGGFRDDPAERAHVVMMVEAGPPTAEAASPPRFPELRERPHAGPFSSYRGHPRSPPQTRTDGLTNDDAHGQMADGCP